MKSKTLKSLLVSGILVASSIGLASCGTSQNLEVINPNTKYASAANIKDFEVKNIDVYNRLRYFSSGNVLKKLIEDKVYTKTELTDKSREYAKKAFLSELINVPKDKTFEQHVKDTNLTDELMKENIAKYADKLYLEARIENIDEVINSLTASFIPVQSANQSVSDAFLQSAYKKELHQYNEAIVQFEKDFEDKESDVYPTDSKILKHFQEKMLHDYSVKYLSFNLISNQELRDTFELLNIKLSGNGTWYRIPDINNVIKENKLDEYPYSKNLLTSNSLPTDKALNEYELHQFYIKYSLTGGANNLKDPQTAEIKNTETDKFAVIKAFVEVYNKLNKTSLTVSAEGQVMDGSNEAKIVETKHYKDFKSSTLRDYIFNLSTAEGKKRFSTETVSADNKFYLVYLISDEGKVDASKYYNKDTKEFITDEAVKAKVEEVKKEAKEQLKKELLNDEYIKNNASKSQKDIKIYVYDSVVYALLKKELKSSNYKVYKKNLDKENIIKFNDSSKLSPITISEFYNFGNKLFGSTLAKQILVEKYALDNYGFNKEQKDSKTRVNEKDLSESKTQLKNILTQFSNNQFEQHGFAAKDGRVEFLINYYHVDNYNDALKRIETQKAIAYYQKDYNKQVPELFTKLKLISDKMQAEHKSFYLNHLLVYIDLDMDGRMDKDLTLTDEQQTAIASLFNKGIESVTREEKPFEELKKFAENFNKVTRIVPRSAYEKVGDGTSATIQIKESLKVSEQLSLEKAVELRQLGLNAKAEDLGSSKATTNSTNDPGSTSKFDQAFFDHAINFYNTSMQGKDITNQDFKLDKPVIELKSDTEEQIKGKLESLKSSFGYHSLVLYKVDPTPIAKNQDQETDFLVNGHKLNLKNDSNTLTPEQLNVYFLNDSATLAKVEFKDPLKKSLSTFAKVLLDKYKQNEVQEIVADKVLGKILFNNVRDQENYSQFIQITERKINYYQDMSKSNNYTKIFADWIRTIKE